MGAFAKTSGGRERWGGSATAPRHRHAEAYAALVLSGGYEECGNHGRFRVRPGDVLLHNAFDAHLDRFDHRGAEILNLVLPEEFCVSLGFAYVDDADNIACIAQFDAVRAAEQLTTEMKPQLASCADWPDLLASELIEHPDLRLDDWADAHGLAAATVSRGFARIFGVAPIAYRAEARAHRAYFRISHGRSALAEIAAETGFADQPHMTRAVKSLTGLSPGEWRRRSNRFKTECLPVA